MKKQTKKPVPAVEMAEKQWGVSREKFKQFVIRLDEYEKEHSIPRAIRGLPLPPKSAGGLPAKALLQYFIDIMDDNSALDMDTVHAVSYFIQSLPGIKLEKHFCVIDSQDFIDSHIKAIAERPKEATGGSVYHP